MKVTREILESIIREEINNIIIEEGWKDKLKAAALATSLAASPAAGMEDVTDEPPEASMVDKRNDVKPLQYSEPELPTGFPSFMTGPELEKKKAGKEKIKISKKVDKKEAPETIQPLSLGEGYNSLETLAGDLQNINSSIFNSHSPEGRAALAIALSIGGTEVFGKGMKQKDFYNLMGGTGDTMQGFAQFNTRYYNKEINTSEKYVGLLGDMITGKRRFPNGKTRLDAASKLAADIDSGRVKNGEDLIEWLKANRFGGSNWQGIDAGWARVPGLADQLVRFVRGDGNA
jgi:hypothetical protein